MTTSDDAKVIAEATKWLAEYDAIPTKDAYRHFRTHYPLAVYNGALYTRTLLRLLQSRAPATAAESTQFGMAIHEMDVAAFFNMRDWLQNAVEAKGARMIGGGLGLGQADIDIELEGMPYNISIRPLPITKTEG